MVLSTAERVRRFAAETDSLKGQWVSPMVALERQGTQTAEDTVEAVDRTEVKLHRTGPAIKLGSLVAPCMSDMFVAVVSFAVVDTAG